MLITKLIIIIIAACTSLLSSDFDSLKVSSSNFNHYSINIKDDLKTLNEDKKIILESEYLDSGNKIIYHEDMQNLTKKTSSKFHVGTGIAIPIGQTLSNNNSPGFSIFIDVHTKLKFDFLNKTVENSLQIDHTIFNKDIKLKSTSIFLNNEITLKKIPLTISIGSGLNNSNKNYFTNSINLKYIIPNTNIIFNSYLKGCWNSFSIKNKVFGINVVFEKSFNFDQ